MKLYTATDKTGVVLAWAGTQADARTTKKETHAACWQEVEVSTHKADFLEFLKLNCCNIVIKQP